MKKDLYENVPGRGKRLDDGTWWVNSSTVAVGTIAKDPIIPGNYIQVCEVVEVAVFDGKQFARWKRLPNE